MDKVKKRKLDTLTHLLKDGSEDFTWVSDDDINVVAELKEYIAPDELTAYLLEQHHKKDILQVNTNKEQELNPFADLNTPKLKTLIDHSHKIVAVGARIELARRELFYFTNLQAPDFYKEDRDFLKVLCNEIQDFLEKPADEEMVMVANLPPRFGKSRTAGLATRWLYGKNPSFKIMTGSYNEGLSTTFSKSVRDGISEKRLDPEKIVYSDIFPDIKIQIGDAAMNRWALEGQHVSYLATSPSGTATGFGANLIIIDDLIKGDKEAFNDDLLEGHWRWFTDTMFSRLEKGGKILIIMTRWATGDLAGRAIKHFKDIGVGVKEISMKACLNEKTKEMLCKDILSYDRYKVIFNTQSKEIASANYQQIPIDMIGRLYQDFQTYEILPRNEYGKTLFTAVRAYCDTADEGKDYLCNLIYGVYLDRAYILDVYYTQDPMEVTEKETAKRMNEFGVRDADIESNNGGKGFARNVKRILKELFSNVLCQIRWFHQSENKRARILTNASSVQNIVLFPSDWKVRWPEYYEAMFKYQKAGKNKHDDAPDATTGVVEHFSKSPFFIKIIGDDDNDDDFEDSEELDENIKQPGLVQRVFNRFRDGDDNNKWF